MGMPDQSTEGQIVGGQVNLSKDSGSKRNRGVVGLKRSFARIKGSRPTYGLMGPEGIVAGQLSGCASEGLTNVTMGPNEKKSKKSSAEDLGPLIKCDAFPISPISPHLKLKELVRRKGSPTSTILSTVVTIPCNVTERKFLDNTLMDEEAGLSMPPNLP